MMENLKIKHAAKSRLSRLPRAVARMVMAGHLWCLLGSGDVWSVSFDCDG